jgi:RimJ/RimL family protein N-acetyltransferase
MKIETERLVLEDYQDDDWNLFRNLYPDPEINKYVLATDKSEDAWRIFFDICATDRKSNTRRFFYLKMTEKTTGCYIGEAGINIISRNKNGGIGNVGYALLKKYRKLGYATEAVKGTVDYWKQLKTLHKLIALINPLNSDSRKVLKRCNFTKSGYLTKDFMGANSWEDVETYEYLF